MIVDTPINNVLSDTYYSDYLLSKAKSLKDDFTSQLTITENRYLSRDSDFIDIDDNIIPSAIRSESSFFKREIIVDLTDTDKINLV